MKSITADEAYIRFKDKLYFYNKEKNNLDEVNVNSQDLKKIDIILQGSTPGENLSTLAITRIARAIHPGKEQSLFPESQKCVFYAMSFDHLFQQQITRLMDRCSHSKLLDPKHREKPYTKLFKDLGSEHIVIKKYASRIHATKELWAKIFKILQHKENWHLEFNHQKGELQHLVTQTKDKGLKKLFNEIADYADIFSERYKFVVQHNQALTNKDMLSPIETEQKSSTAGIAKFIPIVLPSTAPPQVTQTSVSKPIETSPETGSPTTPENTSTSPRANRH